MRSNLSFDYRAIGRRISQISYPRASRMNDVPLRWSLIITATPGVMISEAINDSVPEGEVAANECIFDGSNEVSGRVHHNHKAATEILHLKILGLLNAP